MIEGDSIEQREVDPNSGLSTDRALGLLRAALAPWITLNRSQAT